MYQLMTLENGQLCFFAPGYPTIHVGAGDQEEELEGMAA